MNPAPYWQHWIYNLSEPALFISCLLIVFALSLVVGGVLLGTRRWAGEQSMSAFPVGLVTAVALPTSLVIGLMANDVARKFNEAQENVLQEARVVASIQYTLATFPASVSAGLQEELRHYVSDELPREAQHLKRAGDGPLPLSAALARLSVGLTALTPTRAAPAAVNEALVESVQSRIRDVQRLRSARSLLALGKMDAPQWLVVGVLLLCCAAVMIEVTAHRRRYLVMAAALFTLSYGSLVYMILTNDRPFSGGVAVSFEPIFRTYQQQLTVLPNLPR